MPERPRSGLAVRRGLPEPSSTRQKEVKLHDPSAVNTGRAWSIQTVAVLPAAWAAATLTGSLDRPFWPLLSGPRDPTASLGCWPRATAT